MTKIAVVSDTHLGSKYQQLTNLREFYDCAQKSGCEAVYHCGDLFDGMTMRKGHEYECFIYGIEDLIKYTTDNYPSSLPTYLIGGNHDHSMRRQCGLDVIRVLAELLPHFNYLGPHNAYKLHDKLKLAIFHGNGMGAASNRLIRTFDTACKDWERPDVVLNGHLHHWNIIPDYGKQKSLLVQLACFKGTTDFDRSKSRSPQIGGLILERLADGTLRYEIRSYDETINDY